jgi:PAS domain S-box-containing protein
LSELDYRQILNSLADAVVTADGAGRITYVNNAAARLLGWPEGELIGRPLVTLIPDRFHPRHEEGFARYLATRVPQLLGRPVRLPTLRRDGGEVEVELTLAALRTGEGQDLFVASLRDLSYRVELERELAITRYLRAANAAAAKLSANLDLNVVLSTVVEALVQDFEAALARIWLYDAATNTLHLRASAGLSTATTTSSRAQIDVTASLYKVAVAARTGQPLVENHLTGNPHSDQEWVEHGNLKSAAAFPLLIGGELLGVCVYFCRQEIRDEVIQVMTGFAALVATAIHDVQLLQRAQAANRALRAEVRERKRAEQVSRGQSAALARTVNALAAKTSLETFLEHAVGAVAEQLKARLVTLWFHDQEHDRIGMRLVYDGKRRVFSTLPSPTPEFTTSGFPVWQELVQTRRPVLIEDPAGDPRLVYRTMAQTPGVKTLLIVPSIQGDRVIGCFGIYGTWRRRYPPEAIELAEALAQQVTLAVQLERLAAQEQQSAVLEERNRIAQEIHDTLAQGFTAILLQLRAARYDLKEAPESAETRLLQAAQLARESLAEARCSVWALRPRALENTDLCGALLRLAEQLTAGASVRISPAIHGTPLLLAPEVEINLLRICQEAVTNVLKHARAQEIRIELHFETEAVRLRIQDDGQGFDPERATHGGFGLPGLRERAQRIGGEFTLCSQTGRGTAVHVRVPLSGPVHVTKCA